MEVKYTIKFVQYGTIIHSTTKSIGNNRKDLTEIHQIHEKYFCNKKCFKKISCHSSSK